MAEPDSDHALYILDASGWIWIDERPDKDRILWFVMKLVEDDRIASPPEVWGELKRCHTVLAWIKQHRKKIVRNPMDQEHANLLGEVHHRYPAMCGTRGTKTKGDGPSVAMGAYYRRKTNRKCNVIASETAVNRPNRKIPTACASFNVEYGSVLGMLRAEFPDERWS
jgi:hypothetical protein